MIIGFRRMLADPPRGMFLAVWLTLIALAYFGSLTLAASFSPRGYSWRHQAISKLLYPSFDPAFHYVASAGVALTGLLMLPIGVYLRQRLHVVSPKIVDVGTFSFTLGAISLLLAGLIVSHPLHGKAIFPHLHEVLARAAAAAFGASILMLWICAVKAYLIRGRPRQWRRLAISWSFVTLPALTVAILRGAAGMHLSWDNPLYAALGDRALWDLGFWEWIGSGAMLLFIASGMLFLPECDVITGDTIKGE